MIGKKLLDAIFAALNKLANAIGVKRDPIALGQLKIDQAAEKIERGQMQLGESKGNLKRAERALATDQQAVAIAQRNFDNAIKAGNATLAQNAGSTLKVAQDSLAKSASYHASAKTQYDNQALMMNQARQVIVTTQETLRRKGIELQNSRANAAAAMLQREFADTIKNPLGDMGNILGEIDQQIDTNNAHAEVNADLGIGVSATQSVDAQFANLEVEEMIRKRQAELGLTQPAAALTDASVEQPFEGQVMAVDGQPVPVVANHK